MQKNGMESVEPLPRTDDGCGTRSATASVGKKISDERK